ncbi:hypothetical protein BDF21DRAFT_430708 [Thamnidium elegans]|uniref:F-box domain-containing protein n=1 Tax=Thamnidium elegans TaxID=101142 RepID=A0A8H7SRN4_9FUNG|nr:hypothetical protein INT48_000242 [Thamnidium elegans]KAI8056401.1 hypothetical protein BDF21DRAFT_430708 [Thamnidium elegans]
MANNSLFPTEILQKIFEYLTEPKDLYRNCQLVCRSWNLATGLSKKEFSVRLLNYQLRPFLGDLKRFSSMGPKVFRITMLPSLGYKCNYDFRAMVNLCQNVSELVFTCSSVYEYVRSINSHEAKLPSIKKIMLQTLKKCTPTLKRYHLWINFRFRDTITHLEIFDLEHMGVLNKSDRLVQFSTSFKHLQNLRVLLQSRDNESVDLDDILSPNKEMKALKLFQLHEVTANKENMTTYPLVTELEITVTKVASVDFFQCIILKFPNLSYLRLLIDEALVHTDLNATENTLIFARFATYCNSIESLGVYYVYNGQAVQMTCLIENKAIVWDEEDMLWDHENMFPEEEFVVDFPADIFEYVEYPSSSAMYDDYLEIDTVTAVEEFENVHPPSTPYEQDYQDMLDDDEYVYRDCLNHLQNLSDGSDFNNGQDYLDYMRNMFDEDLMQRVADEEVTNEGYLDLIESAADEEIATQEHLDAMQNLADEDVMTPEYLDDTYDMEDENGYYDQNYSDTMQDMTEHNEYYDQSYLDSVHNTSEGIDYLATQDFLDSLQRMTEEREYFMTQEDHNIIAVLSKLY